MVEATKCAIRGRTSENNREFNNQEQNYKNQWLKRRRHRKQKIQQQETHKGNRLNLGAPEVYTNEKQEIPHCHNNSKIKYQTRYS